MNNILHGVKVLFVPSNDTMAYWMSKIYKKIPKSEFLVIPEKNEKADNALQSLKIHYYLSKITPISKIRPDCIIFDNDWGQPEIAIINEANKLGIPTISIQEGASDISNHYYSRTKYLLALGKSSYKKYPCKKQYITGNPEFDTIKFSRPYGHKQVMINLNFAYGFDKIKGSRWINDVILTCNQLKLKTFISKHPRDESELPNNLRVIKSNASIIGKEILNSSVVISRNSTIIIEAVKAGRQVVFYNLFHENFNYLSNSKGLIHVATTIKDLKVAIQTAINNTEINKWNTLKSKYDEYIKYHLHNTNNTDLSCVRVITYIIVIEKIKSLLNKILSIKIPNES